MSEDHMTEARHGRRLHSRVAVLCVALLTVGYIAGYLLMSEPPAMNRIGMVRVFEKRWQAEFYRPAASIESLLCTNQTIQTASREP